VIIRLCSIECNFAQPLTHESNRSFAQDIRTGTADGSALRLGLHHGLLPLPAAVPELGCAGAECALLPYNGVVGLFEQGAYQSFSNEMSEMRAWVLAQLLWDPYQDDRKLIHEFLEAYYGPRSAGYIRTISTWSARRLNPLRGHWPSGCEPLPPLLDTCRGRASLAACGGCRPRQPGPALARAAGPVADRIHVGLPMGRIARECLETGKQWPINPSRKAYAAQWLATVNEPAGGLVAHEPDARVGPNASGVCCRGRY